MTEEEIKAAIESGKVEVMTPAQLADMGVLLPPELAADAAAEIPDAELHRAIDDACATLGIARPPGLTLEEVRDEIAEAYTEEDSEGDEEGDQDIDNWNAFTEHRLVRAYEKKFDSDALYAHTSGAVRTADAKLAARADITAVIAREAASKRSENLSELEKSFDSMRAELRERKQYALEAEAKAKAEAAAKPEADKTTGDGATTTATTAAATTATSPETPPLSVEELYANSMKALDDELEQGRQQIEDDVKEAQAEAKAAADAYAASRAAATGGGGAGAGAGAGAGGGAGGRDGGRFPHTGRHFTPGATEGSGASAKRRPKAWGAFIALPTLGFAAVYWWAKWSVNRQEKNLGKDLATMEETVKAAATKQRPEASHNLLVGSTAGSTDELWNPRLVATFDKKNGVYYYPDFSSIHPWYLTIQHSDEAMTAVRAQLLADAVARYNQDEAERAALPDDIRDAEEALVVKRVAAAGQVGRLGVKDEKEEEELFTRVQMWAQQEKDKRRFFAGIPSDEIVRTAGRWQLGARA